MSTEKTYSVYCHTCPNGMQYFGMSGNVEQRWFPCLYKGTSLEPYIDKFGWSNIDHKIVCENLTRDEALKLEDSLIVEARNNGTCINRQRSGHYQQTEEFKEEHKAHRKAYYEAHTEEEKARNNAYHKAYYEAHQDEEKARSKAYREAHRDEISARRRERRKRKKAEKQAKQSDVEVVKATKPKPKRKKPLF